MEKTQWKLSGTRNGKGGLRSSRMAQESIEGVHFREVGQPTIVASSPVLSHPEQRPKSEQKEIANPGTRVCQKRCLEK